MRQARLLINGASYHVTAKANRQEFIFQPDVIKDLFLEVLADAKKKYDFKVINFCVMSNHIHLMIKPLKDACLSDIMQWVLGNFAVKFNKFYCIHGHVWYDRFKSKVIRTFKHYLAAYIYICNNPVKAGIVENAEDYPYSGLFHILNKIFSIIDPPE